MYEPEYVIDLSTPELRAEAAEYEAYLRSQEPRRYVDFHPAPVEPSRYRRRRETYVGPFPVVRASDGAVWR
ncbi:hypothetical protein ACFYUL_17870 [Streptomyces sp. NPDC004311]|uniref:hypothetical protein n=1 Tax=Streptomyces sp. NPDC004311 TaxID=3364698 RepID=UPI003676BEDB